MNRQNFPRGRGNEPRHDNHHGASPRSRDYDRGSHARQFGEGEIGDDRFPHGYPSRERQYGEWDEDRYGYPEATSYGREMQRSRDAYRPEGRFAQYDRPGFRDSEGSLFRGASQQNDYGRGGYGEGGYGIPAESERDRSWRAQGYDRLGRGDAPNYGRHADSDAARFGGQGVFGSRPTGNSSGQYGRQTPKGYTRSDDRIKDDVCEHLYHADDIDVSEVTVEAHNGTITLQGSVPERRMKHRIEDIAEQCIGVLDVENRIRVSRDADRGSSPLATAAAENPGESQNDRSSRNRGSATTTPRH